MLHLSTYWGPIHPWHSARPYGMAGSKTRSLISGKGIGGGGEGEVGTFSRGTVWVLEGFLEEEPHELGR